MKNLFLIASCFLFFSCNGDDDGAQAQRIILPTTPGIGVSPSTLGFNSTYNAIRATLSGNSNIGIVAEVDHSANAASVSLQLDNTKEIFFGNPALGTPLMQKNQLAGLDLPQKILVYEQDGRIYAAYNSTDYLIARHDLSGVATLPQIKTALDGIVNGATKFEVTLNPATVTSGQGIITVPSNNDFNVTLNKLRGNIEANTNLTFVTQLDHQANGARVNLAIRPTSLLIFGNPNLGTPLMQTSRTAGIDLPQKMLVWEAADGKVNISYNDPAYIATRHGITGNTETLQMITTALANLANLGAN